MKPILIFALTAVLALTFASCSKPQTTTQSDSPADMLSDEPDWVKELKLINPLKEDTSCISVYFMCDNRVLGIYDVYGIIYPLYDEQNIDTGWQGWSAMTDAIWIRHNRISGKRFLCACKNSKNHTLNYIAIDLNTRKICNDTDFTGFHTNDIYTFHYYDWNDSTELNQLREANHPIYSKNKYDSRGVTWYEIIRMNSTGMVLVCDTDTIVHNFQ